MNPSLPASVDDPSQWLGPTALVDPECPRLRLKAQSIAQHGRTEREKVLALYGAVKRIPFGKPIKLRLRTGKEVLEAEHADAEDKATLLTAMLRSQGFPARLQYVELHGEILRGLTRAISSAARPVLQVWMDGRWAATDTYIFDAHYAAAARMRLRERAWDWGYGMHRCGHTLWSGHEDAFLTGDATTTAEVSLGQLGLFHDPEAFAGVYREGLPRVGRAMRWNMLAPGMHRAVQDLRTMKPVPQAAPRGAT